MRLPRCDPRPGPFLIIAAAHARAFRAPCNGGNGKLIGKLQYPKKKRNQHILHALHGMCEQLPAAVSPRFFIDLPTPFSSARMVGKKRKTTEARE